jgi:hypothetical protein
MLYAAPAGGWPLDSSDAGGWPLGPTINSAPAFADPELRLTRAVTSRPPPSPLFRRVGARPARCRGGWGPGGRRDRRHRGRADLCAAALARVAPPLLANNYTYSNRVPPRTVDPGRSCRTAVRSTATAGGGQIDRRRWRSTQTDPV